MGPLMFKEGMVVRGTRCHKQNFGSSLTTLNCTHALQDQWQLHLFRYVLSIDLYLRHSIDYYLPLDPSIYLCLQLLYVLATSTSDLYLPLHPAIDLYLPFDLFRPLPPSYRPSSPSSY